MASLAGFILFYAEKIAKEEYLCPIESMHTVVGFVKLYEYLKQAEIDLVDLKEFYFLLMKQLSKLISADTLNWDIEYAKRPTLCISSNKSVFIN